MKQSPDTVNYDDGWIDLIVANDSTPNYIYHNEGNGKFEDVSYTSGAALDENWREQAHMGVVPVVGMSSLFSIDVDRASPMPGKNERQGRSANIFFFHESSLQGHAVQ
jgi:hypothetical protein